MYDLAWLAYVVYQWCKMAFNTYKCASGGWTRSPYFEIGQNGGKRRRGIHHFSGVGGPTATILNQNWVFIIWMKIPKWIRADLRYSKLNLGTYFQISLMAISKIIRVPTSLDITIKDQHFSFVLWPIFAQDQGAALLVRCGLGNNIIIIYINIRSETCAQLLSCKKCQGSTWLPLFLPLLLALLDLLRLPPLFRRRLVRFPFECCLQFIKMFDTNIYFDLKTQQVYKPNIIFNLHVINIHLIEGQGNRTTGRDSVNVCVAIPGPVSPTSNRTRVAKFNSRALSVK